jgi:hypothetical protein
LRANTRSRPSEQQRHRHRRDAVSQRPALATGDEAFEAELLDPDLALAAAITRLLRIRKVSAV